MSTSTTITVPAGMSCVNAFRALWENSSPCIFLKKSVLKRLEPKISTPEKIAKLFKTHTFFASKAGRTLLIDFSRFPVLEISRYDRLNGLGAAHVAILVFIQTPSSERFDRNDSYKFEELVRK